MIKTRGWSFWTLTPGAAPVTPLYWRTEQARGTQLRNKFLRGSPLIPTSGFRFFLLKNDTIKPTCKYLDNNIWYSPLYMYIKKFSTANYIFTWKGLQLDTRGLKLTKNNNFGFPVCLDVRHTLTSYSLQTQSYKWTVRIFCSTIQRCILDLPLIISIIMIFSKSVYILVKSFLEKTDWKKSQHFWK